jgi:RNA-directed DNA polymerase
VDGLRVIDAHIRRRVRAIIVRHRKRPRFLYRHLVSKGASRKAAAGCAYCGKRAWAQSNRPAMSSQAYPPSWFAGRLTSLKDRWHDLNLPLVSDQLSLAL